MMKTVMQYFIPALFLSVAFAGGVYIERFRGCNPRDFNVGPGMHLGMMEKISRDLDLSSDQEKQVSEIFREQREKLRSLRDEIHPKFESVRRETQQRIEAILTPAQIEKFSAIKEHIPPRGMGGRIGGKFFLQRQEGSVEK